MSWPTEKRVERVRELLRQRKHTTLSLRRETGFNHKTVMKYLGLIDGVRRVDRHGYHTQYWLEPGAADGAASSGGPPSGS